MQKAQCLTYKVITRLILSGFRKALHSHACIFIQTLQHCYYFMLSAIVLKSEVVPSMQGRYALTAWCNAASLMFRSGLQSYFKPLHNCLSYSDEDECSPENLVRFCPGPGICTNSDGGFTCDCPDGYEPAPIGCQG